jgi:hypothetical protein
MISLHLGPPGSLWIRWSKRLQARLYLHPLFANSSIPMEILRSSSTKLRGCGRVITKGAWELINFCRRVLDSAVSYFPDEEVFECRFILGTIVLLQNPLSLTNLSRLLDLTPRHIAGLLTGLHSVLAIPREDQTAVVRIIHASFRDFLTNEKRCLDTRLLVQPTLQHEKIVLCLLKHMTEGLQRETFGDENLATQHGKKCIDASLAYACRHWVDHLEHVSQDRSEHDQLVAALDNFTRFYWFMAAQPLESGGATENAIHRATIWLSVCILYLSCLAYIS